MSLILKNLFQLLDLASSLKKDKVKLDLLTNIDIFLMVKKGIRGGIWHSFY